MGTDNLYHKRKQNRLQRNQKKKNINPYILIVCEGEETEPNYFEWYKLHCKQAISVEILGCGKNTESLAKEAFKIKNKTEKKKNIVFDQVWCVFDKDSFSDEAYNNAFQYCNNKKIKVAYSNECFELWYLLHFNFYNSAMSRDTIFTN